VTQLNIVLVGYGYWGPKLARNIEQHDATKLVAIVDANEARMDQAAKEHPGKCIRPALSMALANFTQIDAVVIATPPETHADIAHEALSHGKHVLVEKPITLNTEDARELIAEASAKDCVLMVDHVYCYSAAAKEVKRVIEYENVGKLLYIDSTRINLGLFQQNCDVVWDLAIHDFSLLDYFFPGLQPKTVSAVGTKHYTEHHDSAHIHIDYHDRDVLTHIHVNWLSPVKVRQMILAFTEKSIIWNDMDPVEPVKIYDTSAKATGPDRGRAWQMEYRRGDIRSPRVDQEETLRMMLSEFVTAIVKKRHPRTAGYEGLRVVDSLCLTSLSLQSGGIKKAF
jgi:predicted dehydrogenase